MQKRLITLLQYFFFLGLGIFFVWLTIRDISSEDWQQIRTSLANARHWLIIPALALLLLSHYLRALRWKILMEPLGYQPSTFNTFAAVMIGYLVNAGVPRLGEVVKCTILSRYEKVRADKLVGTIVLERFVDLICLFLVFFFTIVFEGDIIGEYISGLAGKFFEDQSGHLSVKRLAAGIVILVAVILTIHFSLKRFGHIDAVAKIRGMLQGIAHGLISIRYIKHKGFFLFHTVSIWLLYLFSTTIGIYALQETQHLGLGAGLTTLSVGSVGMIITPGGIGAYPLFVANLLGLYGVDVTSTGMALGWLLWSVQTVIIVAGGIIFSALISHYNKNKRDADRQQHTGEDM
jgi:glycosyltransferase 2 family protein